jgi:hypothetical protein
MSLSFGLKVKTLSLKNDYFNRGALEKKIKDTNMHFGFISEPF